MYGRAAIRALRTGLCNMTTAVALEQDILRELLGLSGVGVGMQSNAGGKWAHDATMDCRHAASGQSRKTKKKTTGHTSEGLLPETGLTVQNGVYTGKRLGGIIE